MSVLHVLQPMAAVFTDSYGSINVNFLEALATQIKPFYEAKGRVVLVLPGLQLVGAAKVMSVKKPSGGKNFQLLGDGNVGCAEIITAITLAFRKENLQPAMLTYNAERDIKRSTSKNLIKSKLDDIIGRHLTTVPVIFEETFEDHESIKLATLLASLLAAQSATFMVSRESLDLIVGLAQKFNLSKHEGNNSSIRKSGHIQEFMNLLKKDFGGRRGELLADICRIIAFSLDNTHGKQVYTHVVGSDVKALTQIFKGNESEFRLVPETVK